MPWRYAKRTVEEGRHSTTRAQNLAGKWSAQFIGNWGSIMSYLALLFVCTFLLIVVMLLLPRNNDAFARARRSEALLRSCHSHDDRIRVLQEPAQRVPIESFSTGVLPCGTRLERVKERLIKLHEVEAVFSGAGTQAVRNRSACLTAKHLNHSYAIISVKQSDGVVTFMFNPENYAPVGDGRVTRVETSDFFPAHAPLNVSRPTRAWMSYTDSASKKQRVKLDGATLYCILHAWEVLSGEHYLRFGPTTPAASAA
jgi:peptide deformylase